MDRSDLLKKKKPRFYIVDGNGYIYRAFFALPKLINTKGLPSNAIYGFTNMMRKLINEEKPDYLAVAFDAKEKTFRHDSYQEYKIDRPEMPGDLQQQIPYIRKICEVLNLPVLQVSGYEADDVIATLMERCKEEHLVGVVVTSDKDLLQIVEAHNEIYTMDPMKDYIVYDDAAVQEKWGVPPPKIVELLSIMGDKIDNIPGVKGIGEKGALELILKFGSVEEILNRMDQVEKKSHRQKLEEFKNDLIMSRKLVELRKDVPIDVRIQDLKAGKPNASEARDLFLQLEFYSILNDFLTGSTERAGSYDLITQKDKLESLVQKMLQSPAISFHCEIDSHTAMSGSLVGISLSNESRCGSYIPLGHSLLQMSDYDQLDLKMALDILRPLFASESIVKSAYNLKHQLLILRRYGIEVSGPVEDPMLMSYVLNPTRHSHSLDDLAKEYVQYQRHSEKELMGIGSKRISATEVAIPAARDYGCEITDLVFDLTPLLKADLEKAEMMPVYRTMEQPVLRALVEMEWNGVKIDTNVLRRISEEMGKNLDRLVAEIYALAEGEFNINSPKQLGEVLFVRLKLPMAKKTRKTKEFSTSVDVLEELAKEFELPQKILEYRQFSKLKSTYADALPQMIDSRTGRVHTNYQQTVAATGRLSSVDPNLQNIPIRTPFGRLIRDAFIADEGSWLISADYSQIELRVMAHVSNDPTLIDSFLKNEDIHTRTASEVFGVPMDQMTKDIRNQAKAINYGINYGQSPFGLSQLLGIEQKDAKKYIEDYFEKYPKVKEYLDSTVVFAIQNGYVQTLFGRRRYIPEIHSKDRMVFMAAQRAAINTPLQGTAADIMKLAMIAVQQEIEKTKCQARVIMQVHDELVLEVPDREKESVSAMVKEKMEGVCKMVVPLTVDISIGRNWHEAK